MAPDDRDSRRHDGNDAETNPFVAFRRFADQQISSMFQGFPQPLRDSASSIDKSFEEAQRDLWRRFESTYERATNPERRQTESRGSEDPVNPRQQLGLASSDDKERPSVQDYVRSLFGGGTTQDEKTPQHGSTATQRSASAEEEDHSVLFQCPGFSLSVDPSDCDLGSSDMFQVASEMAKQIHQELDKESPASRAASGLPQPHPHAADDRDSERHVHHGSIFQADEDEHREGSLLALQSPYSPLRLEHEGRIRRRIDWRAAFEDLLCAERGEPQMGEYYNGYLQPQARGSWLMQLLLRGHLDFSNPWHQELFGFDPPYRPGDTPQSLSTKLDTELGIYDLFSGPFGQGVPWRSQYRSDDRVAKQYPTGPPDAEAQSRPRIMSTTTSTHSSVLPDGSTETRRVLKKRFADGREEIEDSTESTPASQSLHQPWDSPSSTLRRLVSPAEHDDASAASDSAGKRERRRNSWFWST